jgi:hypothetical protein
MELHRMALLAAAAASRSAAERRAGAGAATSWAQAGGKVQAAISK